MFNHSVRYSRARVSTAALVLFACSLTAHAKEPAAKTEQQIARFEKEILAFEKWDQQNAVPQNGILFVGSSTIRLWQTAASFPGLPVINRGFGGSTIADVSHYAERIVLKYKPAVIVFYSGDNDIAGGKSPQSVFEDFKAFATLVQEKLPKTRILFLTVKPSVARWKLWPQMQEVNRLVEELAKGNERLSHVDIGPLMLGVDGQPRAELFREDGLHLSEEGYANWNKMLGPILQPYAN